MVRFNTEIVDINRGLLTWRCKDVFVIDVNKEFQLIEITKDYLGYRHTLHAWKIHQWNLCVRVERRKIQGFAWPTGLEKLLEEKPDSWLKIPLE